jgi:hypothetical protein
MNDAIIANAQNAAANPANDPPAPVAPARPTTGTPAAPAPSSPAARLAALNAPGQGIYSADPKTQQSNVKELKMLLAREADDPASRNIADVPADERGAWADSLRSRYGLETPRMPGLEPDEMYDAHVGNALSFMTREGVDADVVKDLYTEAHRELVSGVGVLSDAQLDHLEARYAGKLGKATAAKLRQGYESEVRRGAAAARATASG